MPIKTKDRADLGTLRAKPAVPFPRRTPGRGSARTAMQGRAPGCGLGRPAAGSGIRSAGSVAGLGQHPAQVDNCLGADVFVAGWVEIFGLGPDGHGYFAVVPLLG